jgi:peptidoglycan/LPS O-acetylase OafA/YrhL
LCRWMPRDPFRWIPAIFWMTTAAVFIARAATFLTVPYATETHRFPTHLQIDSLLCGVLLSHYYHTRAWLAVAVRRNVPALIVAATASLTLAQADSSAESRYLMGHLLTMAGFGVIVLLAVATRPQPGRIAQMAARVGAQSYSIYLWHAAVMAFGTVIVSRILGRHVTFYETVAWYVPGTFIIGFVMAKCIEGPSLRLRERLFPDDRVGTSAVAPSLGIPSAAEAAGSATV